MTTTEKFIELLKEDYNDRKNAVVGGYHAKGYEHGETTGEEFWGGFENYFYFVKSQPKLNHIVNNVEEKHLQISFAAIIYDNAKKLKINTLN